MATEKETNKFQDPANGKILISKSELELRARLPHTEGAKKDLPPEESYHALIQLGQDMGEAVVMLRDIDGKEGIHVYTGKIWAGITGYSIDELKGKSFFDLVSPKDRESSITRHRQKMSGKPIPRQFEASIMRKDGKEAIIEISSAVSQRGDIPTNILYIRDVTQRKEMQAELEKSENLYRTVFNTTGTAMQILDGEGNIMRVNEEWVNLFGYTSQEAEGKIHHTELLPKNRIKFQENIFHRRLAEPDSVPNTYETQIIDKMGYKKNVLIAASLIPQTAMRVISLLDITEIKQIERRLRNSESRLRLLSRRIIKAAEAERVGIARELHDELAQGLVVTRLEAVSLADKLQESSQSKQIAYIIEKIDKLLDDVRDISSNLRPKMLDELGLVGAIQWYVRDFERRTGIPCFLEINENAVGVVAGKELAIEAYRILQEAMLNALRHSKAERIVIGVSTKKEKLIISIADNGIGINKREIDSTTSLGLLGMQERASLAGGSFNLRTRPGKGTRIILSFPLSSTGLLDHTEMRRI